MDLHSPWAAAMWNLEINRQELLDEIRRNCLCTEPWIFTKLAVNQISSTRVAHPLSTCRHNLVQRPKENYHFQLASCGRRGYRLILHIEYCMKSELRIFICCAVTISILQIFYNKHFANILQQAFCKYSKPTHTHVFKETLSNTIFVYWAYMH